MEEFELDDLLKVMKKRKWIIIFVTIIATLTGLLLGFKNRNVISVNEEKVYESVASVVVPTFFENNNTNNVSILNSQTLKTYEMIASSQVVAKNTIEQLNLDISIKDFIKNVTIIANNDTQIITIYYKSLGNNNQKNILEVYLSNFIKEGKNIYPKIDIKILDKPSEEKVISNEEIENLKNSNGKSNSNASGKIKSKKMLLIVSFIGGIIFGCILAVLMEYLSNNLKKKEEAEKILELNTITMIPNNNGKNITDILERFRMLRVSIQSRENNVIMLSSVGDNDSKTEVVLNLAEVFVENNLRTLIIEGDLNNPKIKKGLEVKNKISDGTINSVKWTIEGTKNNKLNILNMEHTEIKSFDKSDLKKMLDLVKNEFEYIIIDTASMIDYADSQILAQLADEVLIIAAEYKTNKKELMRLNEVLHINKIKPTGLVWIESNF